MIIFFYFEKDHESFVKQIFEACSKREPSDYSGNGIQSAGTRHADESRLLFVWQNSLTEISKYEEENFSNESSLNHIKKIITIAKERISEVERHIKKLEKKES